MNTTLTVKIDKKLRDDAKKTAAQMGIPLSTAVTTLMRKYVQDRVLVLEAECPFPSHTPNAETRKAIREVQEYIKSGTSKRGDKTAHTTDRMFEQILGKNWRNQVFSA